MKKELKIFLLIIFFSVIFGIYNYVSANSLDSVNIVIMVSEDGVGHVSEEWTVTSEEGSELSHSFKNLGEAQITNFKVKDENNNIYTFVNNWNFEDDLEAKKYKCGIKNSSNGLELCWGISEYSSNAAYFLEYDIINFVTNLSDGNQMINFEFFQKNREEIRHVGINIVSEEVLFEGIAEVWGYGYEKAMCSINTVGEVYFSSLGKLESKEGVGILVRFDSGTFPNVTKTIDHGINYYYESLIKGKDEITNNKKTILLILIFIIVGLIVFIIITALSTDKTKNRK